MNVPTTDRTFGRDLQAAIQRASQLDKDYAAAMRRVLAMECKLRQAQAELNAVRIAHRQAIDHVTAIERMSVKEEEVS